MGVDLDLLGGAIIAASGSFKVDSGVVAEVLVSFITGVVGGGARGLATSVGSSPGKIQRFSSLS